VQSPLAGAPGGAYPARRNETGGGVALGGLADRLIDEIETRGARLGEALFEPVIRLGVTGLSGAGKTVFITSLVANLLERARMHELSAAREGRIRAVFLQPQPDDTVARFDYEAHLARLTGEPPAWPESTRTISELRLSFRLRRGGLRGAVGGERRVHLDIVDYPGEWLLDLALLDQSYRQWSESVLARMRADPSAAAALAAITAAEPAEAHDEAGAAALARGFTAWLTARRAAGMALTGPGRFVLPGEMAGSPALSFAPLPRPDHAPRGSLWREMARRFEVYRAGIVRPFFRDHFARIDRQIVLVDALGALHAGPEALAEMRRLPPGPRKLAGTGAGGAPRLAHPFRRDKGGPPSPHAAPAPRRADGGGARRGAQPRRLCRRRDARDGDRGGARDDRGDADARGAAL